MSCSHLPTGARKGSIEQRGLTGQSLYLMPTQSKVLLEAAVGVAHRCCVSSA